MRLAGCADWGRTASDTYVTFASAHPLESIAILAEHETHDLFARCHDERLG